MRLRLHIAYEGTNYFGWQIQPDVPTVEGALTDAAATILDRSPDAVNLQGASRTDAGVHARGQVAHLDYDEDRTPRALAKGLNALTDDDICINRVERVSDDFHARFSINYKRYRYDLWHHRFPHPFRHRYTWHLERDLDVERMRRAAPLFEGEHDFEAFRSSGCQSETSVRTMRRLAIEDDDARVRIVVEGDNFLRYMVRVMVGTLVEIGCGWLSPDVIPELFESPDRSRAGITAPAGGLTLVDITYPEHPWQTPPPEIGGAWQSD
jgi:tRNA pseudouridine38-40 synthase